MAKPTSKNYRIEGVIVNIPGQPKPIRVKRLPLHIIMPKHTMLPGFQPFRLVINLKMVEAAKPANIVTTFNPPIEIKVRFTAADYAAAISTSGKLKMGYWDGNTWTDCKVSIESKRSPDKGGWLVTKIAHWMDPTLALGS